MKGKFNTIKSLLPKDYQDKRLSKIMIIERCLQFTARLKCVNAFLVSILKQFKIVCDMTDDDGLMC